ncbi:MAG: type II CAAX endopeptidase family protein [Simkaniaceae bacterium]
MKFFKIEKKASLETLSFFYPLFAIMLFLIIPYFLTKHVILLIYRLTSLNTLELQTWAQVINGLFTALSFICLASIQKNRVWKLFFLKRIKLIPLFLLTLLIYVISLPIISFVDYAVEHLTYALFGTFTIDQLAVRFIKSVLPYPYLLSLAIFATVILAPFCEEFLFRGFIQNSLKRLFGLIPTLLITSLLFSLIHYSPSQGYANLPLLTTLFVFSLFLGFSYEKTGSLLAPIFLHLIFNLVTILRIMALYSASNTL